jgi:hypothetical protein
LNSNNNVCKEAQSNILREFFEEKKEQIRQDHPRGSPIFTDFLAVLSQFGFV